MESLAIPRDIFAATIAAEESALRTLNRIIHSNPELAYEEHVAHDTLCAFLTERGFTVTPHAYGLDTAFEAEIGTRGRLIVFCAEYDALPGIGHGCGHNLIATSSIAASIALAVAVRRVAITGRLRILGTPAEEGGGGKAKLIEAGAFSDEIAAAIMAHPTSPQMFDEGISGVAGFESIASQKFRIEFHGRSAHAAGDPWDGVNALDAAVAAYNNISLLRQQIKTDERIHGVIEAGGEAPNVIPNYTRMNWYVRSPTSKRSDALGARVKACLEAGAAATGCTFTYQTAPTYKELVVNDSISKLYVEEMMKQDRNILHRLRTLPTVSTDMGNVSHEVPSFHGVFTIPAGATVTGHSRGFAEAASEDQAHNEALLSAKGMAMVGWRILTDDVVASTIMAEHRISVPKGINNTR